MKQIHKLSMYRAAGAGLVFITFLCIEIAARVILDLPAGRWRDDGDLIIPDSLAGYVYRPNLSETIRSQAFTVHVRTNSFGYRDAEWGTMTRPAERTILVVGDSYSAGYGVQAAQRWSNLLEDRLNTGAGVKTTFKVMNAAVSGYGLQQMVATARKLMPVFRPKLIIIGANVQALDRMQDPYVYFKGFSVRRSKLEFVRVQSGRLYLLHVRSAFWQKVELIFLKHSGLFRLLEARLPLLLRKFRAGNPDKAPADLLRQAQELLTSFAAEARENDAILVVLLILQHEKSGDFSRTSLRINRALAEYCAREKIACVDLTARLQRGVVEGRSFRIGKDSHWNAAAHTLAADAVYEFLQRASLP